MTETTAKPKFSVEQFKAMLQQKELQDFGTVFNEQTQTSYQARTFNRLRFQPRIADLLFFPMLISMPFDPTTGQMTEEFNSRKKYRPFIRPTDFLKGIKAMCNEDAALKKRYMDYANFIGNWDTSETDEFTEDDRKILFIYRRPMTTTHPAVHISDQAITGEKFGGKYLLPTKQNQITGEYEGDISLIHQLGLLSGALQRNEIQSFNTAISEQNPDCISLELDRNFVTVRTFSDIKDVDSDDARLIRQQIRGCYPLGNVSPLLVTPMIRVPVEPITGNIRTFVNVEGGGEEEQLLPQFRNEVSFEGNLLVTDKFSVLDKVNEVVGNAFPKDPTKKKKDRNVDSDVYADFVVLEYITDNEAASFATDAERNQAALKMEAKKERTPLYHRKKGWRDGDLELKAFMDRMGGFYEFATKDNFNNRMAELMLSGYKSTTDVIQDRALRVFADEFSLGDEYKELFNSEILATFPTVLMELWPEEYAEKFEEVEDKVEEGDTNFQSLLEETNTDELNDEQKEEAKAEEGIGEVEI